MMIDFRLALRSAAALAGGLACAAALAQTPVMPGPNTAPGANRGAPGATDCGKAVNKTLPECSQDSHGSARAPDSTGDRGMVRETPRTNDGMNGPMSAPRPPGDTIEGGDKMTPAPR
jgi:hypothetical protein